MSIRPKRFCIIKLRGDVAHLAPTNPLFAGNVHWQRQISLSSLRWSVAAIAHTGAGRMGGSVIWLHACGCVCVCEGSQFYIFNFLFKTDLKGYRLALPFLLVFWYLALLGKRPENGLLNPAPGLFVLLNSCLKAQFFSSLKISRIVANQSCGAGGVWASCPMVMVFLIATKKNARVPISTAVKVSLLLLYMNKRTMSLCLPDGPPLLRVSAGGRDCFKS